MKPSEYATDDPIVAIATALVPAALGVVRASGVGSIDLVARVFSRPAALTAAAGNTLVHGWLVTPDGGKIDEVMLAVYRAPRSFTGEDAVEVIAHGGPATVLAAYRLLVQAGFRPAERGEFTFRAFTNGKTDLSRAEAVREIIAADTDEARARAVQRLAGSIHAEAGEIRAMILKALAAIEVEIEYPEDEETTAGAFDAEGLTAARDRLARLAGTWAGEKLYQDGARVVLAGRTNAGKSSIFNALLKEERSIVSDIPGTTRDWIESRVDVGGIPTRLFDTAGLRLTADSIEAEGVERSKGLAADADLVLYLVDASEGLSADDGRFLSALAIPALLVWNKSDRADAQPTPSLADAALAGAECLKAILPVSAKTGSGLAALIAAAAALLRGDAVPGADHSDAGPDGTVSPRRKTEAHGHARLGSERQKAAVLNALDFVEHALTAAAEGFPMDAIVQDLEDALAHIGEITGETTAADVLDAVFTGFCVGK
jgi:tRNA modification GTPase